MASIMTYIAFDIFDKIFGATWRLLSAFSILLLLAPINLRVFISLVSREIAFVLTASNASGMVRK